ncbi:MAG: DNA polymerase III subunit delta' [Magnetococcales bacterium]|nr:DNA polymerase III subunit delta' [Magnetococcales bacterium]MBF0148690.1 DNA polymerase III subunit delta' [Magnetococcales bacterium]MBF0631496.1 DNA polymerase III subunit delta' [Magnetococcales bacterium]
MNEILGHQEVIRGLRAGLATGTMPHASLFIGPSGVGKATVAQAYVRSLMCPVTRGGETLGGCQRCEVCHKIDVRCHADLQWVEKEEGKTRISIDQVRELSRFLSLTPMEAEWKVAIVDDAAEMNAAAANALLKTLEEPPANSILVLITSRPGILLPTIRSRCVKHDFQSLSKVDFFRILQAKVGLAEDRLDAVMHYSEGNLGFALQFVKDGQLVECDRLSSELDGLLREGRLASLCNFAENWSQANVHLVQFGVRRWLMEQVRERVHEGERPDQVRAWLSIAAFANEMFTLAETFNVNRRLLLEGILIKILRISGAVL